MSFYIHTFLFARHTALLYIIFVTALQKLLPPTMSIPFIYPSLHITKEDLDADVNTYKDQSMIAVVVNYVLPHVSGLSLV